MTLAEQFGRRLFMARRRVCLSREGLAKAAGLHRETIYLLEKGRRSPKLDTIWLVARALGLRPGELIDGLEPAGPRPEPHRRSVGILAAPADTGVQDAQG